MGVNPEAGRGKKTAGYPGNREITGGYLELYEENKKIAADLQPSVTLRSILAESGRNSVPGIK